MAKIKKNDDINLGAVKAGKTKNARALSITMLKEGDNIRVKYDKPLLNDLADSIDMNGLIVPITVYPEIKEGEMTGFYIIEDGHRRFRALKILESRDKWKSPVDCVIDFMHYSETTKAIRRFTANYHRADLSREETATVVRMIVKEKGSQSEAARFLSKSQTWVSKAMTAATLIDEHPEAKGLPINTQAAIATLPEKKKAVVIAQVKDESLSQKETEKLVKKQKTVKTGRPTELKYIKVAKWFIKQLESLSDEQKKSAFKMVQDWIEKN